MSSRVFNHRTLVTVRREEVVIVHFRKRQANKSSADCLAFQKQTL